MAAIPADSGMLLNALKKSNSLLVALNKRNNKLLSSQVALKGLPKAQIANMELYYKNFNGFMGKIALAEAKKDNFISKFKKSGGGEE